MKSLINRLQRDVAKLQDTFEKESADFIERIRRVELKDNIEVKKRELEKVISTKIKNLEPVYDSFLNELRKNAKKAGIDVDRIEKEIKKRASVAGKRLGIKKKSTKKTKSSAKKKTAAKKTVKKVAKKVTATKKKTTTKKTSSSRLRKKKES